MIVQKSLGFLRYLAIVTVAGMSIILLVELGAWVLHPSRYDNAPDVTADAWIYSDGLAPVDTVWMKEFVEEFCRSYRARWSSYVYYRREPFSGKHITVDSAGIRATLPQGKPSADGRRPARVFLFGGSTMWGTGARDSGTIPSALARLIMNDPEAGPAIVVNMGESGYVSTQALLRLELELREGNIPDIVILYDGVNDVYSAFQNGEPGLPQNEFHRATEFNLLRDGGRMRALGVKDLLGRTVTASVLQSIRSTIAGTPPAAPPPDTALAGGICSLYGGNLSILEGLSRQYGFRYQAYWQPVVFSRQNPSPYERAQSEKQKQVGPFFAEAYRRVGQDAGLRSNPHFHNLSGVFDDVGPMYIDFCHITETGNGIVARAMYADIRGLLHEPQRR